MVPYERTIPVKQQKVPEYNEFVLGGGKLKKKINETLGNQIGKRRKARPIQ